MNVRYRARALADLDDIFRYLDQRSPAGARNVLHAIHRAIEEIADQPLAAVRTSELDMARSQFEACPSCQHFTTSR